MYPTAFRNYDNPDIKMMYLEHIRNGLFVILDTASDIIFTGTREQLRLYKRTKKDVSAVNDSAPITPSTDTH